MPDGKPTKAPVIIFGTMVGMSIITVAIVFITHARRTKPYLDNRMRRVKQVEVPAPVGPAAVTSKAPVEPPSPVVHDDAGTEDSPDAAGE